MGENGCFLCRRAFFSRPPEKLHRDRVVPRYLQCPFWVSSAFWPAKISRLAAPRVADPYVWKKCFPQRATFWSRSPGTSFSFEDRPSGDGCSCLQRMPRTGLHARKNQNRFVRSFPDYPPHISSSTCGAFENRRSDTLPESRPGPPLAEANPHLCDKCRRQ